MTATDPMLGRTLDGYTLSERIGAGATGVVYRASREGDAKPYAVKVLNEALGHIKSLRRRFEREARALSRLTHEHIVDIADFGVTEDAVFIAMEFLSGDTLEDRLQRAPLDPAEALRLMRQILEGLAFAHEQQIVHRDLKPANVFLVEKPGEASSWAKILDFGLAKFLSIDELSQEGTLTRKGRVVGTPAYMAPEQITGVSLDVRADVYAAGVLLFELLADRRPFDYDRRSQLLRAHLFEPIPKLSDVRAELEVEPALEAIVRRALAKDPAERFPDARAFLQALAPFGDESARLAGRKRRRAERSRAGTSSVIITAEERAKASSSEPEARPLGSLPPTPPPGALDTIVDTGSTSRPRGWVNVAVWVFGLASFGALLALAYYATTLR
ncbi:MAG: serine/threonine protein kinase [Sandaracinus sp.]|nr:serine/threonine protein kinase [Sandaracinus sp.]MCB9621934.1 serine/threonine protein kinase [Sandaracinus sp.]MCB9636632.1 serine/threonine protein kinase [Sandaracinus sp.]